jgi:hypothetical protein
MKGAIMVRTYIVMVAGLAFLFGARLSGQDVKGQQKDPPRQIEGSVKMVENRDGGTNYLTVTAKEKQSTSEEDIFREIDKDYRFEVPATTKVFGMDGKPDKRGLKSLETGMLVRVDYRKNQALEVKRLPAKTASE